MELQGHISASHRIDREYFKREFAKIGSRSLAKPQRKPVAV